MILCSACLLGLNCRYDGKNKPNKKILELSKIKRLIPICPEQLGGRSTPRPNAEIYNGTGIDILDKKTKVIESNGKDVTEYFIKGAEETLYIANMLNIKEAILKQRSPSCGYGQIYDGTFSKKIIKGNGVTTAMLLRERIKVFSEEELIE